MLAVLIILGAVAYLQAGYQIGRASIDVWNADDNASTKSFLLFPTSHIRGNVGGGDCFYTECNDTGGYLCVMAVAWPIKVVWNAAALAMLAPAKISRLRAAACAALPAPPPRKALPEGSPVVKIAALLEERKRIDGEIESIRTEILSEIETEEIANPEVRQIVKHGLKS